MHAPGLQVGAGALPARLRLPGGRHPVAAGLGARGPEPGVAPHGRAAGGLVSLEICIAAPCALQHPVESPVACLSLAPSHQQLVIRHVDCVSRWGAGPCLTGAIDGFAPGGRAAARLPLRMPLSDVFRNARGTSLLGGKLEVQHCQRTFTMSAPAEQYFNCCIMSHVGCRQWQLLHTLLSCLEDSGSIASALPVHRWVLVDLAAGWGAEGGHQGGGGALRAVGKRQSGRGGGRRRGVCVCGGQRGPQPHRHRHPGAGWVAAGCGRLRASRTTGC